jgi:VCBS repeat-containing protein
VSVSLAGGATISAGANASSTLTLSGTQAQINAALASISYQGSLNFNGSDTLTVLSTDSNAVTGSDTVAITVSSVNDAPVNTVPGAQTVNEDTALTFTGGNTISVNDVDGNLSTTRLTVTSGTVTVSLAGGATISAGANSSSTLTLSGTQAQINAALASLSYQGNLNFNGSDTLTVLSTDSNAGDRFGLGCYHRELGERRAGEHGTRCADGE